MKRVVVALAVLLGTYGLARADYVIIVYNLGVQKEKSGGANGGMPGAFQGMPGGALGLGGMPGGVAGAGGMGPPGGVSGARGSPGPGGFGGAGGMAPPGGVSGARGSPGPGGFGGAGGMAPPGGVSGARGSPGPGGGSGFGGTQPPGGMGGAGGMAPPGGAGGIPGSMGGTAPPGGFGGAGGMQPPGGFGGAGGMQPPGGFGGMGGMQPPGGFGGAGGMQPPGAMAGGFGLMGGFGLGGQPAQPQEQLTPLYAIAVVEVKTASRVGTTSAFHVRHKWGYSVVVPKAQEGHIWAQLFKRETILQLLEKRKVEWHPAKPIASELRKLAEWTLQHNLLDEFVKTMDEWAKLDDKDPAVVAFRQVQLDMARAITKPDVSDFWRTKVLDNYRVERSEHYALLHDMVADRAEPVKSRLKRLEDNYRAFFYWFALQGKVLKVPDQRLVAVLVKRGEEFKRQQQIFDSLPTVADGFLARRDNLAVFSLERTDAASEALEQNTKVTWQKLTTDRDASLKKWPRGAKGERLDDAYGAEIQTIALLERALEEDAEIASVTHEGTRQLLAATHELPRNVAVPEWLQFGWAAFFETPKGSPWMTVGSPSSTVLPEFNYLSHYKAAVKAGKIDKKQLEAMLEKVVTDADFRDYAAKPKNEEARVKARTLSWALTYFLATKKLDGLRRYHEELKKLPRDLEFDPRTLLLAFARAFDCLDASSPNTVDRAKLTKLAEQWHDTIWLLPGEDEKLLQELIAAQAELKAKNHPAKPGEGTKPGAPK